MVCAESQLTNSDVAVSLATSGGMSLSDMLKRYAFSFYEVVVRIEDLRSEARAFVSLDSHSYGGPKTMGEFRRPSMIACLKEMRTECEKLDLIHTASLISFSESEVQRKGDDYTYADMLKELDTLSFSFAEELRRNSCFRIATEKDKYFQKDDLFGAHVNTAFPSCADEIENAGNCYALQQNEACVFHCMRILERGLRALAKELGVTFSGTLDLQNWQNIIENVESAIKDLEKLPKSKYKSETLKLFSQAAMQFRWFKEAWRNHIMHGRDSYDDGRAHSIFGHVQELMQALAEGGLAE
jgi:hypothetical protein